MITVVKVKGHATQNMVDIGEVSEVDRWGNSQADDAARRGAAMHPPVVDTLTQIGASRRLASAVAMWIGVGLEVAQKSGALPMELTRAEKHDRPQLKPRKRVEIIPDEVWKEAKLQEHLTSAVHPSHSIKKVGQFHFCEVCGSYGATKLMALAAPCPRSTTPSRQFLLRRMLAGCHPRSGEFLGDVVRPDPDFRVQLTATKRRSHSV